MKVLFVASGNTKDHEMVPFIKSQGVSLSDAGVQMFYFSIVGKGWRGYLKNIKKLCVWLQQNPVDLIHAHYSLSGWVAVLAAGRTPVVLSLMGDDAFGTFNSAGKVTFNSRFLILLTWLIQPFVKAIIYKSPNIAKAIYRRKISHHIPNGVNLQQFALNPQGYHEELGLDRSRRYILFLGNPSDKRKNFALAKEAIERLSCPDVVLVAPYPIQHDEVVKYLNSVDVLVLCSFAEGSPNVIKEAMSCNCPLVATDVGDVAWLIGNTPGCYLAGFNPEDFSAKLKQCLDFATNVGRTEGRNRLIALGLDGASVARRLISIYQKVLKKPWSYTSVSMAYNKK